MKRNVYFFMACLILFASAMPVVARSEHAKPEFLCPDPGEIPVLECEALVALYNSTNGNAWTDHTGWLETDTPGDWYGVEVDSGHVIGIHLHANNLVGNLPSNLGNLSHITILSLRENQLTGVIPLGLDSLTSLTSLDLADNQLSGSIPSTFDASLANLQYLWLDSNQLSGEIPPQIGEMTNLIHLNLAGNQFSGSIPSSLRYLTNLVGLFLLDNSLSGSIPPELGEMSSLKAIYFDSNNLTGGIPSSLGLLPNLETLSLGGNLLDGSIPSELGLSPKLKWLLLADNHLSGTIPPELGYITTLEVLHLRNNWLEGDTPGDLSLLVNLVDPGMAEEGSDGLVLDFNMLNIPPGYPVPGNPLHEFLNQKDPDWQLHQGFGENIGSGGGELTSLDGHTDILIPAGAVEGDTLFTYLPRWFPDQDYSRMIFINNSYYLTAEDAENNPVTVFSQPITVTITYTDADIRALSEDSLRLFYWNDATGWTDAVTTCAGGEYTRDPDENKFYLSLCHLSEFGVFGSPWQRFLPVLRR